MKLIAKIKDETQKQKILDRVSYVFAVGFIVIVFSLLIINPDEEIIKNWLIIGFILGGILIILRFLTDIWYGGKINKYQIKVIVTINGNDEILYKKLKGMLNRQVDEIYKELLSRII